MEFLVRAKMKANYLDASDTLTTSRKIMGKLLGSRMISKQETCHLINSLPLVSCSHRFLMINFKKISNFLDIDTETTSEVTIMSIIDAYWKRHLESTYHTSCLPRIHLPDIVQMTFEICSLVLRGSETVI